MITGSNFLLLKTENLFHLLAAAIALWIDMVCVSGFVLISSKNFQIFKKLTFTIFKKHVFHLRMKYKFELLQIGNMNETPVCFYLPTNRRVEKKGAKKVLIRTKCHEKKRFAIVLICMADRARLYRMIIFKQKTLPKGIHFPSGIIARAHSKCWMDENGIFFGSKRVKEKGRFFKNQSFLFWDTFEPYLTENVKQLSCDMGSSLIFCSYDPRWHYVILQPLNVYLNKLFKYRLLSKWTEWISSGYAALRNSGNNKEKKDGIVTMSEWAKES